MTYAINYSSSDKIGQEFRIFLDKRSLNIYRFAADRISGWFYKTQFEYVYVLITSNRFDMINEIK